MLLSRGARLVAVLLVLLGTAGCDHATKHLARTRIAESPLMLPGGFLELNLAHNPGAFLSMGSDLPQWLRISINLGVAVGLFCLLGYLVAAKRPKWAVFFSLALLWAGGVSNLIDRALHRGLVTDFMILRLGPLHTGIFNIADVVIVLGIALFVASARENKQQSNDGGME